MLLFDLSHTSHSQARTGVQRVSLELRRALKALPRYLTEVTHDPYAGDWRPLQKWELDALEAAPRTTKRRGSYWPLAAQLRGRMVRWRRGDPASFLASTKPTGFFTPEIFTQRTAHALPRLFKRITGPKIALFHDAISLRLPAMAPANAVARFPTYLAELHDFDGVVALSADSRQSLLDYWEWAGWDNPPEVRVIPAGVDHLTEPTVPVASRGQPNAGVPPLTVLCVGSIEGRKNHLTLLEACEILWRQGETFTLHLIGTLQRLTGAPALTRIQELQQGGRPITYDGWVSEPDLQRAYADCAFTVYPSLMEGFGFPVWESLLHAKPCVCSPQGATGETAAGGGCLTPDVRSARSLAETMQQLLKNTDLRERLTLEARNRLAPRWSDCAQGLVDWSDELSRAKSN